MNCSIFRIIFLMGLIFGFCHSFSFGQKNVRKQLLDSTRVQAKLYLKQARLSVDSFHRAEKHKLDSIRAKNNPDTIPFTKNFRFGIDLSKPLNSILNKTQQDFEFSVDYQKKLRYFYVAEAGYESIHYSVTNSYQYQSSGEYLKLGFDYGIFKVTRRKDHNIIFTGLRLGAGNVAYKADSIVIPNSYFGNTGTPPIKGNATGLWLEAVFGAKVEVFSKFFVGWTLRLDSRLNNLTKKDNYPVRVPGYGNSSSAQAFNYSYSIFYTF